MHKLSTKQEISMSFCS